MDVQIYESNSNQGSFDVHFNVVSDSDEMGEYPDQGLNFVSYFLLPLVDMGLIEEITGVVKSTDQLEKDEAYSRRIKEGELLEKDHNKCNMAASSSTLPLSNITNSPTKAKAAPTKPAPTPTKSLKFDPDNNLQSKAPVFSSEPNQNLGGLTFCVSGTYPYDDDSDNWGYNNINKGKSVVGKAITNGGGTRVESVNKDTDFLIVGENPGTKKLNKAHVKGVQIIDLSLFHQLATGKISVADLRKKENVKISAVASVNRRLKRKRKR